MPQGGSVPTEIATGVVIDSAGSVADATNYYWAGLDGSINRVALSGGPVTVLVPASVGSVINGLAVDATYVYFAFSSTCNASLGAPSCPTPSPMASPIMRVPIAGGAATVVVTDYDVDGIAVDGKNVYWIDPYDSVKWASLASNDGAAVQLGPQVVTYRTVRDRCVGPGIPGVRFAMGSALGFLPSGDAEGVERVN